MKNILVSGLYFSGSSAVTDLLSQYKNIGRVPGEFDFFRRQGMIGDHIAGNINTDNPCNIKNIERALKYNLRQYYPSYIQEQVKLSSYFKYLIACTPYKYIYRGGLLKNVTKKVRLLQDLRLSLESCNNSEQKLNAGKCFLEKYT